MLCRHIIYYYDVQYLRKTSQKNRVSRVKNSSFPFPIENLLPLECRNIIHELMLVLDYIYYSDVWIN